MNRQRIETTGVHDHSGATVSTKISLAQKEFIMDAANMQKTSAALQIMSSIDVYNRKRAREDANAPAIPAPAPKQISNFIYRARKKGCGASTLENP